MSIIKKKTIAVEVPVHIGLKKLCKTHKKDMGKFLMHTVNYLTQSGIDPEHAQTESPQKAIKELTKRVEQIIGVIKTQEQDKINPLLEQLMMLSRRAELMLGDAPKEATFKSVLERMGEMLNEEAKNHEKRLDTQVEDHKLAMETLKYSQQNIHTNYIKKMDEVIKKMDKMTADQEQIKEVIETKLSKKIF